MAKENVTGSDENFLERLDNGKREAVGVIDYCQEMIVIW